MTCDLLNRPDLRWPRRLLGGLLLLLLAQTGCARLTAHTAEAPVLEFEDTSGDAVHVFLQIGDALVRLSRVEPLSRVRLHVSLNSITKARLVVVPAGWLASFRDPNIGAAVAYSTDAYLIPDLLVQVWRFSGSMLMPGGIAGRLR